MSPREGQWCTDSCRSASIHAEATNTLLCVARFPLPQVRRSWATFGEGVQRLADLSQRQPECVRDPDDGDTPQCGSRESAMVALGPLERNQSCSGSRNSEQDFQPPPVRCHWLSEANPLFANACFSNQTPKRKHLGASVVAGAGFEPATFGL